MSLDPSSRSTVQLVEREYTFTIQNVIWDNRIGYTFIFDQWYSDKLDVYLWLWLNESFSIKGAEVMALKIIEG